MPAAPCFYIIDIKDEFILLCGFTPFLAPTSDLFRAHYHAWLPGRGFHDLE
jgi:hypothetical protein